MAAPVQTCYRHDDRRAGVRCQRCERPICPQCMVSAPVGFHCPECARSGRQRVYTAASMRQVNPPYLTYVLIAVNAAVFVAGLAERSSEAFAGQTGFIIDGGLFGPAVEAGEWWRIVTAGFLHAGLMHLAFNMFALYQLGLVLEPALGRLRFGVLYGASMLAGSFGVLLVSPDQLTVGASGAVFGLLGGLVVAMRERGINPMQTSIGTILMLNLFITFAIPGISIGGHIGGLVGGMAAGWLLQEGGRRALGSDVGATVAAAALGIAAAAGCLAVA
ncbi:MAG: rhomboid family intramembrane serine protease [Acidimicrobiales bacterium]